MLTLFAVTACVPVSTVPFHLRETPPVAVESPSLEKDGLYSSPAFDAADAVLAAYDSASRMVRIFRATGLTPVNSFQPTRRPRRLSFSPRGNFLVVEAHQGWVEDYLGKAPTQNVAIDSPAAVRDDIQRAEIWNLHTGQTISGLHCDAVTNTEPMAGWLWARRTAMAPGHRSSALLAAHFSEDESQFSMLCWNGVQQRWDSRTWLRLADLPPPAFWPGERAASGPAPS